jgi:uncharacterized protein YfiM (DUF2279 family)
MKRLLWIVFFPLALAAGTSDVDRTVSFDRWFAKDKAQHIAVSFIATGFSAYRLKHDVGWRGGDARRGGAAFAITLGLGKEFSDRTHPNNHFCFKDLAADGIGIAAALLLVGSW